MKLDRQINTLTYSEYLHLLENYKKFTDFNHLGLFRSILENEKLAPTQKFEIRDASVEKFPKFFEFLQLKDPVTYFSLVTFQQTLTPADNHQVWEEIKRNQQRILAVKKLGHRNIGTYAKHDCGYETCSLNGLMIRQETWLAERKIHFCTDKNEYAARSKSEMRRRNRKQQKQIIEQDLAGNPIVGFCRLL
ncbi:MAG: hypothetical protein ACRYFK_15065 [Janthinobacterium lividum]